MNCAKTAISACLFKKKCEDADNFYRQQLLIKKIEEGHSGSGSGNELKPEDATAAKRVETAEGGQVKRRSSDSGASSSSSGTGSSSSSDSGSSSSSSDDDDDEDNDTSANPNPIPNPNPNGNSQVEEHAQNGHGLQNGSLNGSQQQQLLAEQHEPDDDEDEMEQQQQRQQQDDEQDDAALGQRALEQQQLQEEGHEDEDMPEHLAFNSIRLMQEYMQQRMNKFPNGSRSSAAIDPHELHELHEQQQREHEHDGDGDGDGDDDEDEEMSLPLIPEIELITPSDDAAGMLAGGSSDPDGTGMPNGVAGVAAGSGGILHAGVTSAGHVRGFQCPHCFLIFEMKQILKAHMQSVHGAPGPVYECTNCRKTYFYKRFLEKHIRRGRCVKKRRNQT